MKFWSEYSQKTKKNLQFIIFRYNLSVTIKKFLKLLNIIMAKGKRTYVGMQSTETNLQGYVTNIQKKNFGPGEKLVLRKYDKKLRKHVEFKMKEIKKGVGLIRGGQKVIYDKLSADKKEGKDNARVFMDKVLVEMDDILKEF